MTHLAVVHRTLIELLFSLHYMAMVLASDRLLGNLKTRKLVAAQGLRLAARSGHLAYVLFVHEGTASKRGNGGRDAQNLGSPLVLLPARSPQNGRMENIRHFVVNVNLAV